MQYEGRNLASSKIRGLVTKSRTLASQHKIYFQSGFLYLFSAIFPAIIAIAINPFLAKNLSPLDYAIIGYFNSFNVIVLPILNFSLIAYYLRNYYKIPDERKQIVSDTILIALLVYGFVALVIICIVFYLYCQFSKISFPFYPYALLTFVPIYLGNFITFYQVNCRLKRDAYKFFKITIFNAIIATTLAILLVVVYKYGATGRLSAGLIASIGISVYCFKQSFSKFQFDFAVIKDAFHFGWPLSLSSLFWFFLSGIDKSMLEKLDDSYTFGFYNVGFQIAAYMAIFYSAIVKTFEPDIYKAIAENKKRKLVKILAGVITLSAIPNIIFILFAPLIVGLLTYNRYTDAYTYAQILALKNITLSLFFVTNIVIVGYGFTKSELLIRIISAALCYIMFKLLIDQFDFYGAAWGNVFAFVIITIINLCFLIYKLSTYKNG